MRWLFALTLIAAPLFAQEYVESAGVLTDDAFYRLVSCAAPPGGDCQKEEVRWMRENRPIRVSLRQIDPAYLGGKAKRAEAALVRAAQELNRIDAGFRIALVDEAAEAEIEVFFLDIERGQPIAGTGITGVDGSTLGGASTRVLFSRETGEILRVAVVFSTTLGIQSYESVMLEELAQAMGLMTDIRNPYYDDKSIFSQDSNAMKTLGFQDEMALRRHYAR